MTGNIVRITPAPTRRIYEIVEIVGFVAMELDAEVRITARADAVEVRPPPH